MKLDDSAFKQNSYTLENAYWHNIVRLIIHFIFLMVVCFTPLILFDTTIMNRYWTPPLIFTLSISSFSVLFKMAKIFLSELNQSNPIPDLNKVILHRLFGVFTPPLMINTNPEKYFKPIKISHGALEDSNDGWVTWLGGPALLSVDADSAVYIEKGVQFSRVEGSGLVFLHRDETIKYIVDLRSNTKNVSIGAWTTNGIYVEIGAELRYQIGSIKTKAINENRRFSFDPLSIKQAVEARTILFDETENGFKENDFGNIPVGKLRAKLSDYIRSHSIDEILSKKSGIDLDQQLEDWKKELNDGLEQSGIIIREIKIDKDIKTDYPIVIKTVQESWAAKDESQRIIERGEIEVAKFKELATSKFEKVRERERALRKEIEGIAPHHFHLYVDMRMREAERDVENSIIRSQLIDQLLIDLKKSIKNWSDSDTDS
ncbi:MAG: hypothetical protein KGZ85_07275 [Ignavibacterium sp.]|nr:hypothetical protein [Ignavibacterium sp.]